MDVMMILHAYTQKSSGDKECIPIQYNNICYNMFGDSRAAGRWASSENQTLELTLNHQGG